ncbi:hypothetical protein AJ79_04257 [Helicocarpus griseus UAMH5409]|uniref:WW domain-containing protein n=1 Tax=Helicocarpus griseus UAMH5409 TaxID=1447875 RepID=A0A2B7XUR9_9EURO|nr:hypothetical protein AJ79_04257 [Helicocarpus griseus UAMH5409]
MSFFEHFEGLRVDSKDGESKEKKYEDEYRREREYEPYGQPPGYGQQPPYGQQPYGQQPPYGPVLPTGPPPGYPPPLPVGWAQQWDQNYQRAYYVEQATGRPFWELPFNNASGYEGSRGLAGEYYGGEGQHSYGGEQSKHHESYNHEHSEKEEKEKKEKKEGFSTGQMVAAGAAGLAVGAVGGALIAHELGEESGDEHENSERALPDMSEGAPPPPEEYPSDASSSDIEELQEAYEEVYEE